MDYSLPENVLQNWIIASRPKTLLAAFVPVFVGSALAIQQGNFTFIVSFVALLCSILIQVGTNFTNDLYDYRKGADNEKRKGPQRVLLSGLISPQQMKLGIIITFGIAFLLGLYLVYIGGTIILIIGICSILAGLAYTAGPFPLAYNGLGDVFVFIFFGLIGTVGTYYLHLQEITMVTFIAAIPVGALITNILVVNNYRDINEDREAGKNTLAVIAGKRFSRYQFLILLGVSFLIPLILFVYYDFNGWIFLPYVTLPAAAMIVKMLFTLTGENLNKTLELTAKFSALYGLLFSIGIIL